ncbi:phage holin family protein [Actinomadura luteofluorescens]|uniref:Putative membrane protein n=1 Tax=Actinomadura luteofluorescens TaxID=46163 RepID=A0A7Y9JGV6_9ACTN|nr:phage holin family protein [Actinomadura luteofluorescens]NYD47993.1 putative membrane protein [Actinomadura luteofluorescens]
MRILLKVVATAVALWVATVLIDGITLGDQTTGRRILTLVAVAVIFGLVNAVLKPIIKTLGCAFYVITLGLIGLVVNALLLWLTSELAEGLELPFHVTGFWPAFWGAIVVGVVGWLLHLFLPDDDDKDRD